MASTKIYRSAGTPTSSKKFTISFWVKRSNIGSAGNGHIFDTYTNSTNRSQIHFDDDNVIDFRLQVSGSNTGRLKTNRVFRDTSAWYHIVASINTTLSTADDRVKLYINGVQETSFSSRINPSQNADFPMAGTHTFGAYGGGTNFFDGSLSHVHFTDGYVYPASTFGSTDSTTGQWKINTSPSITMGNNGFTVLKDGNTITDQSSNSNNFTLSGPLTKTQDCPSNVFNTLNRNFLTRHENGSTSVPGMLQNGNTTFNSTANAFYGWRAGTIGVTSGKYYWEGKIIDKGRMYIGICYPNVVQGINEPFYDNQTYSAVMINNSGEVYGRYTGSAIDTYASNVSFANNDKIGFALDMDNKALYIHKNGTYINSGNPASGASRTGSVIEQLTGTRDSYLGSGNFVSPFVGDPSSSGTHHTEFNFGNGYFGTSAVSSAGTNASGNGIFEYDTPTGYSALSTKGLNL